MLKFVNQEIDSILKYLNQNYSTEKDVFIHICEEYDTIQSPDGGIGFGLFIKPESKEDLPHIYIAGNMPNDDKELIETITHEYKHFLQWCNNEEFDEEEADLFAEKAVKDLCKTQQ